MISAIPVSGLQECVKVVQEIVEGVALAKVRFQPQLLQSALFTSIIVQPTSMRAFGGTDSRAVCAHVLCRRTGTHLGGVAALFDCCTDASRLVCATCACANDLTGF